MRIARFVIGCVLFGFLGCDAEHSIGSSDAGDMNHDGSRDAGPSADSGVDAGPLDGGEDAGHDGGPGTWVPGEVQCGQGACGADSFCLVCGTWTGSELSQTCTPRPSDGGWVHCAPPAQGTLDVLCDDHDDCSPGERCALERGSIGERLICQPLAAISCPDAGTWGGGWQRCSADSDCSGCGLTCNPYYSRAELASIQVCRL